MISRQTVTEKEQRVPALERTDNNTDKTNLPEVLPMEINISISLNVAGPINLE